jgi:L-tartrate/succinate antiporter
MWVAIATTCVTSSMFLTGLAPNLLAMEMVNKTAKVTISWTQWFMAFAPIGILLLALIPLVTYWLYPPEVKAGDAVPKWAGEELAKLGGLTNREITLGVLVLLALGMWIFGGDYINATTAALVVISLMLVLGVVSWDDIVNNSPAWNTLAWFPRRSSRWPTASIGSASSSGLPTPSARTWVASRRSPRCSCWCLSSTLRTTCSRALPRTSRQCCR